MPEQNQFAPVQPPTLETVEKLMQAGPAGLEPEQAITAPASEAGSLPDVQPKDGLSEAELEQMRAEEVAFRWQASEYVHHHKGTGWYAGLAALVTGLIAIAVYSGYWLEIGVFLTMAAAVVVYARKPPRVLTYELSSQGIMVEGRAYPYSAFRSFGVIPDESWHTIDLEPVKRLSPRLAILFDEQDFEEIVGHLELHLPRVDRLPDPVERITRYIRF